MTKRAKLPRRVAIELLRGMSRNVRNMIRTWDWTPHMERYMGADPSLSRDEWAMLYRYATALEQQAQALKELARDQYRGL